jgi:hypothetical protein
VGLGHLEQILRVYVQHYNRHRPHRALGLETPDPPTELHAAKDRQGKVRRATCSAAYSTSTGELRERICAPHGIRMYVVSRQIERIGDNAVDIAEQVAFLVTGEFHEFTDASHPEIEHPELLERRGSPDWRITEPNTGN